MQYNKSEDMTKKSDNQERQKNGKSLLMPTVMAFVIALILCGCFPSPHERKMDRATCMGNLKCIFFAYYESESPPTVGGDEALAQLLMSKYGDRRSAHCNADRESGDFSYYYTGNVRPTDIGILAIEKRTNHRGCRFVLFSDGRISIFDEETWVKDCRSYLIGLANGAPGKELAYETWDKLVLPKDNGIEKAEDLEYEYQSWNDFKASQNGIPSASTPSLTTPPTNSEAEKKE